MKWKKRERKGESNGCMAEERERDGARVRWPSVESEPHKPKHDKAKIEVYGSNGVGRGVW